MESLERELRRLAAVHMRRERPGHTLQATALVNEVFLRLFGSDAQQAIQWAGRQHFLSAASQAMRRILVDYARQRAAGKRGGIAAHLDAADATVDGLSPDVIDVHTALEEFGRIAPRQAQLVELRFFGGLTLEESAGVLGISARLADKDWALARAWLRRRLKDATRDG